MYMQTFSKLPTQTLTQSRFPNVENSSLESTYLASSILVYQARPSSMLS